jgi:hypothetical protein
MVAIGNSCFWLANFQKSSPLKPLGQMNWDLVGSIYGMFSITIAHPQAILVSDWLISKKNLLPWNRIRNKNCLWRPCLLMNWN